MNFVKRLLQYIDIQRLGGVNEILGVDFASDRVRVVRLRKRGNVLNRLKAHFTALDAFAVEFDPQSALSEKSEKLREVLQQRGIQSKFVVSNIPVSEIRVITATVPPNVGNIEEWIKSNKERLLGLPIASNQVSIGYEMLGDSNTPVEITFVKNAAIEKLKSYFHHAGLQLVGIGAGNRDASNALLVNDIDVSRGTIRFIYVDHNLLSHVVLQDGKRIKAEHQFVEVEKDREATLANLQQEGDEEVNVLVAGDIGKDGFDQHRVLKPFGLSPEFTLAAGLAVKGSVPEMSPVTFLTSDEKERIETVLYRTLFQRSVLAFGSVLLILLCIQTLVTFFLEYRRDDIDQQLLALGHSYAEVAVLSKQVKELEAQTKGDGAFARRTNVAKVLHDVAAALPEGAWLYKTKLEENGGNATLSLLGYMRENEKITDYLKNLSGCCSEVSLIRSGIPLQSESVIPVHNRSRFLTFEIRATAVN